METNYWNDLKQTTKDYFITIKCWINQDKMKKKHIIISVLSWRIIYTSEIHYKFDDANSKYVGKVIED